MELGFHYLTHRYKLERSSKVNAKIATQANACGGSTALEAGCSPVAVEGADDAEGGADAKEGADDMEGCIEGCGLG